MTQNELPHDDETMTRRRTMHPQPATPFRYESLRSGRTPFTRADVGSAQGFSSRWSDVSEDEAVPGSLPRWPALVRDRAADSGPLLGPGSPIDTPEAEVYQLGELCAEAYMQSEALHFRALLLLAEFHRLEGWKSTSFPSTAEWLAWHVGITLGPARERVRTATALMNLPRTAQAMQNGELSFAKVRALTRVATPENEETLLAFAQEGSAANLERLVRGWKKLDRKSEVTAEQLRHRSRRMSAWVDDDGMVVVKGRLDPEVGAVFMRAIEAASDSLYRDERKESGRDGSENTDRCCRPQKEGRAPDEATPEQRRADAVGLLAERALAAGFGGPPAAGDSESGQQKAVGEGEDRSHPTDSAPISGSRAERYQVMLHVDADTLDEDAEPGLSELEDGTRVSAETSRRIACDSGLVTIHHDSDGSIIGASHRTRTVPPAVRRALEARDRGCRFPGCGLRFTDAHHIKHWADGGETTLRNLVLLCRKHHRAVHEGGMRVCLDVNGQVAFFTTKNRAIFDAPPPKLGVGRDGVWSEPNEKMVGGGPTCEAAGTGPARTKSTQPFPEPQVAPGAGAARWTHDHHIPWEIEARAWEALDSG
jgi:hypothetical protein